MTYYEYLRSRQWRFLCSCVWRRCHGICEQCGQEPMRHTHHLTYERLFHERLDDLLGLCELCHACSHWHGAKPSKPLSWDELAVEFKRL
jgi:hypothetical protein